MLDWKILAASFAALLVVSSVLVGGFGFTDILDQLNDWMGDSPFGGFVTAPMRASKEAAITITPSAFEFQVDDSDFEIARADFKDFSGKVRANFSKETVEFLQSDTSLSVSFPISEFTIPEVSIGNLLIEEADFLVTSSDLETSGQGATLEVHDFSGSVTIDKDSVHLDGNVTLVRGNGKDIV